MTTTKMPYTVKEAWESDPVGNEKDGRWVYHVVHDTEGHIKEHRWYSSALKQATQLNVLASRRTA